MWAWLRRYGKEAGLFLVLFSALHLYKTRSHPSGEAPRISGPALDGRSLVVGGAAEEPVLIHFWATWCGVCRLEQSSIESLSQGRKVIGVASRSGSAADVARYMRQHSLSFPVINDPEGALARKYGVHEYPSSFFVSPSGDIFSSEVGYTTSLGLRLRLWLAGF